MERDNVDATVAQDKSRPAAARYLVYAFFAVPGTIHVLYGSAAVVIVPLARLWGLMFTCLESKP